MTAHAHATRAEALEDAIRQCAQVAEGVREGYSSADSLETVLGAIDVLMERVRTAPREDVGGATLTLTLEEARLLRATLLFAVEEIDNHCDDGDEDPIQYDGVRLKTGALLLLRKRINSQIVRNCERRAPAVEIGDEGAIL